MILRGYLLRTIQELETLTDKWLYFIKSAKTLETVPETMAQIPELQKAFTILTLL